MTTTTEKFTRTLNGRQYSVRQYGDRFELAYQPLNAKTGKPWQAFRTVQAFEGHNAELRARWSLVKLKA